MSYIDRYNNLDEKGLASLVGHKVTAVEMSEERLVFTTDVGEFVYEVEGDCCSYSYFYDLIGKEKLIENGPVVSVGTIDLKEPDDEDAERDECVQVYGFEIVTEHPRWGEQTTVFSFRNASNGYYGGSMYLVSAPEVKVD